MLCLPCRPAVPAPGWAHPQEPQRRQTTLVVAQGRGEVAAAKGLVAAPPLLDLRAGGVSGGGGAGKAASLSAPGALQRLKGPCARRYAQLHRRPQHTPRLLVEDGGEGLGGRAQRTRARKVLAGGVAGVLRNK